MYCGLGIVGLLGLWVFASFFFPSVSVPLLLPAKVHAICRCRCRLSRTVFQCTNVSFPFATIHFIMILYDYFRCNGTANSLHDIKLMVFTSQFREGCDIKKLCLYQFLQKSRRQT
ncbi:hypothetical protein NC652_021059 [Populus alba x Populus x berolinensis]|uniref:Uncharacterized protein n=1 Tax=Populus alba x Populus x berolinensis TaxID=444605 RepID=A0AAD6MNN9_9ROSI|nr:hypothetical protein NC652_021059 [Populus alba x Populus x berolinensis]KAJ6987647.1 hypothetical protein NC653_020791 [Populus alba x Populus x berolinensis]